MISCPLSNFNITTKKATKTYNKNPKSDGPMNQHYKRLPVQILKTQTLRCPTIEPKHIRICTCEDS